MTVTLLGPQRFVTTLADTVREVAPDGVVATVTAGWQEREPDDAELDGLLDGRSTNLGLWVRWQDVLERDTDFAAADRRRREVLADLAGVYGLLLNHALTAVYELQRRPGHPDIAAAAVEDALEGVRTLDARHLARTREVDAEFWAGIAPDERPVVAQHRHEVGAVVGAAAVLAIAGGHVADLVDCLHLFNVAASLHGQPVVAWSGGAMAVTDKVVVFHDAAPQGPGHAEVLGAGLGLVRRIVALPHARRRLRLDDTERTAVLARRFAPSVCVVLDDGLRVDLPEREAPCPPGTPVLQPDGAVAPLAA